MFVSCLDLIQVTLQPPCVADSYTLTRWTTIGVTWREWSSVDSPPSSVGTRGEHQLALITAIDACRAMLLKSAAALSKTVAVPDEVG